MTWLQINFENEGETENFSVPVVLLPSLFMYSSSIKVWTTDNSRMYHRINMLSKYLGDFNLSDTGDHVFR